MTRSLFLLATVFIALPANAQPASTRPEVIAARQDFKAQLESVPVPILAKNKKLPGIAAAYSVDNRGCWTYYNIKYPAYRQGGTDLDARTEAFSLHWQQVKSISLAGDQVIVTTISSMKPFDSSNRTFYAGSIEGAQRLKATMDILATACAIPA